MLTKLPCNKYLAYNNSNIKNIIFRFCFFVCLFFFKLKNESSIASALTFATHCNFENSRWVGTNRGLFWSWEFSWGWWEWKPEIENKVVENVNHFDYLEATIYGGGSSTNEIRKRIAIAKQKLGKMSKLWKSLNLKTTTRLMKVCILPVVLYEETENHTLINQIKSKSLILSASLINIIVLKQHS